MTAEEAQARLIALSTPDGAARAQRFFKTGPGEYAEYDRFLGVRVPEVRRVAREARGLGLDGIEALLRSGWHEVRLLALLVLVDTYRRAAPPERAAIAAFYLGHTAHVDNWDLVDSSAYHILGPHVEATGDLDTLDRLAASTSVWERRIAIVSTFHQIRRGAFTPTLHLAETLRDDPHDLIHKATGWMLREVARRDREAVEAFLRQHHARMPRTMLRTAIEPFPEPLRRQFLQGALPPTR